MKERQSICGAWRKYIKYKVLDKVTRDMEYSYYYVQCKGVSRFVTTEWWTHPEHPKQTKCSVFDLDSKGPHWIFLYNRPMDYRAGTRSRI